MKPRKNNNVIQTRNKVKERKRLIEYKSDVGLTPKKVGVADFAPADADSFFLRIRPKWKKMDEKVGL